MYFDSAIIGLLLIAIGWLLQLISSWNGERRIKKRFIMFNNLGVAWLVVDSFVKGLVSVAIFNLIVLVIASILLIRMGKSDVTKNIPKRKVKRRK